MPQAERVSGSTEIPSSSIRNGYSFVPWVEPRYLTTRQTARRNRFGDPVIEQNDAIGNIFFQTVPRQRARAALGGYDGRQFRS